MVQKKASVWVKSQNGHSSPPSVSYWDEMDKLLAELEATQRTLYEVLHERPPDSTIIR